MSSSLISGRPFVHEDDAAWPAVPQAAAAGAPMAFEPPVEHASRVPSNAADDEEIPEPSELRLRRAARLAATRWTGASAGGALTGIAAGGLGGLILAAAPGSAAPIAIATLQEPDEGRIRLGAIDVLNQKDEVRKTLGCLPQEFGVYPGDEHRASIAVCSTASEAIPAPGPPRFRQRALGILALA